MSLLVDNLNNSSFVKLAAILPRVNEQREHRNEGHVVSNRGVDPKSMHGEGLAAIYY